MDDDIYLAKILRSILETFEVGHVRMSETYDDAVIILKKHRLDCIFVDNMMCVKDGLKLAKYIRLSDEYRIQKVPIILCTAFTGLKSITDARDVGITEILVKPVSPEQIMNKLSNTLFNERPFIMSDAYSGPDRRRRVRDFHETGDRRMADIPLPEELRKVTDDPGGDN